jgi:hypothetical protein
MYAHRGPPRLYSFKNTLFLGVILVQISFGLGKINSIYNELFSGQST